jgi:putative membrane protein
MVTDHSKAGEEVKALAATKSIPLPTAIDAKHQTEHDRLAAMSGAAFDKAYVDAMVADHEKDVAEFKHQATMNQDPDVKVWAHKTLPTLEAHLNKVKSLQKSLGTTN